MPELVKRLTESSELAGRLAQSMAFVLLYRTDGYGSLTFVIG